MSGYEPKPFSSIDGKKLREIEIFETPHNPSLGIIHLFALSGMQVGFFLGWFRYGLLRLGLPKDYLFIILLPFSLCYGLMTGWTASVLRSLIQSLLAEFGIKKLDNMGITLLLLFLFLPHFLFTVGGVLVVPMLFCCVCLILRHHIIQALNLSHSINTLAG